VCVGVYTRWVGLHVIVEKTKIYAYFHVAKNSYSRDVSYWPGRFKCLYSRIFSRPPQCWRGARLLILHLSNSISTDLSSYS
jgi:hypothetical protein